jgi:hypothetical protein
MSELFSWLGETPPPPPQADQPQEEPLQGDPYEIPEWAGSNDWD